MGAAQDVDRVQLQQANVVDRTPQAAGVDPAVRPPSTHALRSECDAPRVRRTQLDLGADAHVLILTPTRSPTHKPHPGLSPSRPTFEVRALAFTNRSQIVVGAASRWCAARDSNPEPAG